MFMFTFNTKYKGLYLLLPVPFIWFNFNSTYSGTSIIQSPRDQTVLFELLRLGIIEG